MNAQLHTILDRHRNSSADFAKASHFTLDEGQAVGSSILLEESHWTPYALDDEKRLVYLLQCPAEIDLSESAFMYTAQFNHAQRLLSLSYESFIALIPKLKRPEKIIFVYSMGRCGSTLMSKILNQVDGVYSLSEPDIFTLIAYLREKDGSRDEELSQLMEACSLLLYPHQSSPNKTTLALKFRSNVLALADLLQKAFPNAVNLFMYRNALGWAKSVYRFLMRLSFPITEAYPREKSIQLWTGLTGGEPAYLEPHLGDKDSFYFSDLLVPAWMSYLQRYQVNLERGLEFHCLRYEELNHAPEASLKALFDYCGLPLSSLQKSLTAFEKDSQEGTNISRDVRVDEMPEERVTQFLELLSQQESFNDADLIL